MNLIEPLLEQMIELGASDLYITIDSPPTFRVEGVNTPGNQSPLSAEDTIRLVENVLSEKQLRDFHQEKEANLALVLGDHGRFRCNIFQQRGAFGMVIREIKLTVPTIEELDLPPIIETIASMKRGLVLVVGATGSGKSTSLAAMIDHRNSTETGHIVSIEDPVEYLHRHKKSIITQREVGFDTLSFRDALRNTLRQAPDVILIGEIRDAETMEAAITFAETGHLCLATLHSNNANQAIERIINFFPHERHNQIYLQLSLNLRAILSQRLIKGTSGPRVAAFEIMMDTPRVRDLIKKGEVDLLKDAMEQGVQEYCQTFDMGLLQLHVAGRISFEEALAQADSPNNLRLRIQNEQLKTTGKMEMVEMGEMGEAGKPALRMERKQPQMLRR